MIKLNDLRKELIEVTNDELGLVVGGGSYDLGGQISPLTGIKSGNIGVGVGPVKVGYETNVLPGGRSLNETYKGSVQVTPNLAVGGSFDGVSKSGGATVDYKTDSFKGTAFANPGAIGFQIGGTF